MIKDITGCKFGRLLVLHFSHMNNRHNAMWKCRCDCGNIKIVSGTHLRTGNTRSCGCLQNETSYARKPDSIKTRLYHAVRHGAVTKREIEFTISKDEFFELVSSNCYYCGASPNNLFEKSLLYSGIDRVDSSRGYISGNVVSCCKDCNHAKAEMNTSQFAKWIDKISKSSFFLFRKFGGSHVTLNY